MMSHQSTPEGYRRTFSFVRLVRKVDFVSDVILVSAFFGIMGQDSKNGRGNILLSGFPSSHKVKNQFVTRLISTQEGI